MYSKSPFKPRRASVNVAALNGSGGSFGSGGSGGSGGGGGGGGGPSSSNYEKRSFRKKEKDSSATTPRASGARRRASLGGAGRPGGGGGIMLAPTIDFSKLSNSLKRDKMDEAIDQADATTKQDDDNASNGSAGSAEPETGGAATSGISSGGHGSSSAFSCTGEHKKDGTNHSEFDPKCVLHMLDYGNGDKATTHNHEHNHNHSHGHSHSSRDASDASSKMVMKRRASVATAGVGDRQRDLLSVPAPPGNPRYQAAMSSLYSSIDDDDDDDNSNKQGLTPEGLAAAIKNKPKSRIRRSKSFDPDGSWDFSVASGMGEEDWKQFRRQSIASKMMNPHFGGGPKRSRLARKASMDVTGNGMGDRQGFGGGMNNQSLKAKMEALKSSAGNYDRSSKSSNMRGSSSSGKLDTLMDSSDRKAGGIRSRGSTGNLLDAAMDSSNRNDVATTRAKGNSGRLDAMMESRERKMGVKRSTSRSSRRSADKGMDDISQSEHIPRRQSNDLRRNLNRSNSDPDHLLDSSRQQNSDNEDDDHNDRLLSRCDTQGSSKSSLKEAVQRSLLDEPSDDAVPPNKSSSLKEALLSPTRKDSGRHKRKSGNSLTSMVATTAPEGVQLRKASSAARLAGLATNTTPTTERKTRSSSKTRSPSKDRAQSTPRRSSRQKVGSSSSSPPKDAPGSKTPKTPGKRRPSSAAKMAKIAEACRLSESDSFNLLSNNSNNDVAANPSATATGAGMPPATTTTTTTTVRRHNPAETWICDCGYELRLIMKFCGMCASPQNWTCAHCGFDQNLHAFRFCGNCATPKTVKSDNFSGNRSTTVVEKPKAMKLISPNSVAIDLDGSDESAME